MIIINFLSKWQRIRSPNCTNCTFCPWMYILCPTNRQEWQRNKMHRRATSCQIQSLGFSHQPIWWYLFFFLLECVLCPLHTKGRYRFCLWLLILCNFVTYFPQMHPFECAVTCHLLQSHCDVQNNAIAASLVCQLRNKFSASYLQWSLFHTQVGATVCNGHDN